MTAPLLMSPLIGPLGRILRFCLSAEWRSTLIAPIVANAVPVELVSPTRDRVHPPAGHELAVNPATR